MLSPPAASSTPAKPRKLGCWFYGCTTLLLLAVLGAVGLWFGGRYAVRKLRENFTSAQPAPIEHVELPSEEWTNLQQKVQKFSEALDKGESEELVLTEDQLNAYINHDPKLKKIRDSIHVTIQGDQIGGQISYRLPSEPGMLKLLGLGGRYLNGNATFDINLSGGRLHVYLQKLEVNGKQVPDAQLHELRKTDLAKDVQDPKAEAALRKYESIQVRDGKIILKSKTGLPEPEPSSPAPEPLPN